MSALGKALPSHRSRPRVAGRWAAQAPVLGAGLVVLGVEALLAAAIVMPRLQLLLLAAVGVGALALVFRFPLASTAGLVVLTASVFHEQFFGAGFGPGGLRPYELLLGALLFVALVRPRRQTWGGIAGMGLTLFLVLAAVSTVIAVSTGQIDLNKAYQWFRPLFLLAIFFVVVRLTEDATGARRLLAAAAGAAALSAVIAVLLAYADTLDDIFKDPGSQYVSQEEGIKGFDRVRLPAVALAYALFFYAIAALMRARGAARVAWSLTVLALTVHLGLSLNRNMWVGLVAGTVLLLMLWDPRARARLGVGLAVTAVAFTTVLSVGPVGGLGSVLEPLAKRGLSVVSGLDENGSLRDRQRETRKAWATLGENPLIGIGAGTSYGSFTSSPALDGSFVRVPRRFVHNQYLYLALIAGIPALLGFLLFLGSVLRQAFARSHRGPELITCGVGVTMLALSAVVMLSFSSYNMITALALLSGCTVVMAAEPAASAPHRAHAR